MSRLPVIVLSPADLVCRHSRPYASNRTRAAMLNRPNEAHGDGAEGQRPREPRFACRRCRAALSAERTQGQAAMGIKLS